MTLNTKFYITTDGIDPNTVWNALLDMVEPEDFPRSREEYTETSNATEKGWGPTGSTITNTQVGIGLNAWCFMWHNEDGTALAYDDDENTTDDLEKADADEDLWFEPRGYIRLAFDTAYGYRGPHDEGCSDLHGRIVTYLAGIVTALGGEYAWQDEYTGEWFTDLSHVPYFGRF